MENTEKLAKAFEAKAKKIIAGTHWCPICNYPLYDGECVNCTDIKRTEEENKRQRREFDIQRLGGLRPYEDFTLEKFDSTQYDAGKAVELAQWHDNLYIWGERGTGKTHLATAIIRSKPEGVVTNPQVILRAIKDKAKESKEEQRILNYYIRHRALCIDDLGTEKLTAHTRSALYEIINGRWLQKVDGLIVTSNFSPDELARQLEDDRIISRLIGMSKVIRLSGSDRRLEENT